MYPNYYYQPQRQPVQMNLKGRPVSSLDEARAMAIDFDGSIFYFPDLANNRIYTKQINLDGTSSLNMYELKPIQIEQPIVGDFVTRQEFAQAIENLQQMLQPKPQTPKEEIKF